MIVVKRLQAQQKERDIEVSEFMSKAKLETKKDMNVGFLFKNKTTITVTVSFLLHMMMVLLRVRLRLLFVLLLLFVFQIPSINAFSMTMMTSSSSSSSITTSMDGNNNNNNNQQRRIVILGGTGRIGTAVAIHLLQRDPNCHVVLVGRGGKSTSSPTTTSSNNDNKKILSALNEVLMETKVDSHRVSTAQITSVWDGTCPIYQDLVNTADCLIHTAGPYIDQKPIPLQMAIQSPKCQAYVDVSDPLPYLETSVLLSHDAVASNLTALVAAGAFPGMSNVLAKEAASTLENTYNRRIQDVRFNYFTAGLGGSGVVNLYITNLGFGEPMVQYDRGELRWYLSLSGLLLGKVDFFLSTKNDNNILNPKAQIGNELVKQRVGRQTVFAWPFPEAATVAKTLNIRGNSYAAMGTAPDIWNVMLGVLVKLVPRQFWKNPKFSKFMADFSQPLVLATDTLLKQQQQRTTGGIGETHAMRIDVTSIAGPREVSTGVSIVQAHDSFRRCVGQSCAEFALDIMNVTTTTSPKRPGVYLPEQYYENSNDRARIIEKLTTTPGTFCYTGPVPSDIAPYPPSDWDQAIAEANEKEMNMA